MVFLIYFLVKTKSSSPKYISYQVPQTMGPHWVRTSQIIVIFFWVKESSYFYFSNLNIDCILRNKMTYIHIDYSMFKIYLKNRLGNTRFKIIGYFPTPIRICFLFNNVFLRQVIVIDESSRRTRARSAGLVVR